MQPVTISQNSHGFSLFELVITIAIMGILMAIAMPNWTRLVPDYELNNSMRQIQSELHSIKMRAAAENISFQLVYLQDATAYMIQRDSQPVQSKPLAPGTAITKAGTIAFSPRGTASGNRVRLQNGQGSCRQVVVSATGRVRTCTPSNCADDC